MRSVSAATPEAYRSDRMFSATVRPATWLLYRACVSLRQILSVRKPRPAKRARKVAALCCVYLSLVNHVQARDETAPPEPFPEVADVGVPAIERIRPLRQVSTAIAPPPGDLPQDVAQTRFAMAPLIRASEISGRGWAEFTYAWQAPALSYRPLYFEEPNLERYGHSAGCALQPAVSGAHFLVAVPALPIRMAFDRPWERVYPLGHARPGSVAPWERPW
jgi:hypothetical protein